MTMTAILPNGELMTLLTIKDWDFSWQDRYFFENTISLPKGTKLDAEVSWDNSAENPKNPSNPPIPIKWGASSRKMKWEQCTCRCIPRRNQISRNFRPTMESTYVRLRFPR